jgi:hypothetical protein
MNDGETISRFCVYTILHSDTLKAALGNGGRGAATEKHVWITGKELFDEARRNGIRMPIIFAAAEDGPKGLLYYAMLEGVETDSLNQTTAYKFTELKEIHARPPLSSLRKKSDGRPLSDDFIRPYSICYTPSFVEG